MMVLDVSDKCAGYPLQINAIMIQETPILDREDRVFESLGHQSQRVTSWHFAGHIGKLLSAVYRRPLLTGCVLCRH